MKPEARIKANIREWVRSKGGYVFAPVQTGMGESTLDQLICLGGKFVASEAKVPGNKPTARQANTIAAIQAAGGIAFWCTSLEDFKVKMIENGFNL